MKKITIIGKGTVGCLAVVHFLKWTDWEIDWIFDPTINPTAVGEGTTLRLPRSLKENIYFNSADMQNVFSTSKLGVWKKNWGSEGKEFYHPFLAGEVGMHFNAIELQKYLFEKICQNRRIKTIENNVTNYEELDSDFVMVCTGSPSKVETDAEFKIHKNIPVNSCIVFHTPWDFAKFNFSVTFAKKYGWAFGIPLTNRCSIGYLYNEEYSTEDQIKDDIQETLNEFDLQPTRTNAIKFKNYSRKKNFTEKVCYNGNASFFLEPLEATSTSFSDDVIRLAFDLWNGRLDVNSVNNVYNTEINYIESMICLHYMSGSIFENDFWNNAKKLGLEKVKQNFIEKNQFAKIIKQALYDKEMFTDENIGTWPLHSYRTNIKNLNLENKMRELIVKYKI